MARTSKLLSKELGEMARHELRAIGKDALLSRKLEAILAASKYNIALVAKVYDISRATLAQWVKHLRDGKLHKLKAPPERKRKSIMDDKDRALIKGWIEMNPQVTMQWLIHKISEATDKKVSKSTMHREVQRMRYSYITPRKQHVKQDPILVEEFKKKDADSSCRK